MKKILFLFTAIFATILILVIFFAFSVLQQPKLNNTQIAIPTKIPSNSNSNNTSQTHPPILYDTKETNTLVESAKNRKGLSQNGSVAKAKLTSTLNNISGNAYASSQVRIDYVKSPDVFQAEILSTNIPSAKQEAVSWMISQGFTKDDVCRLPFSFYLNTKASDSLKNTGTVFSPLPDGC